MGNFSSPLSSHRSLPSSRSSARNTPSSEPTNTRPPAIAGVASTVSSVVTCQRSLRVLKSTAWITPSTVPNTTTPSATAASEVIAPLTWTVHSTAGCRRAGPGTRPCNCVPPRVIGHAGDPKSAAGAAGTGTAPAALGFFPHPASPTITANAATVRQKRAVAGGRRSENPGGVMGWARDTGGRVSFHQPPPAIPKWRKIRGVIRDHTRCTALIGHSNEGLAWLFRVRCRHPSVFQMTGAPSS